MGRVIGFAQQKGGVGKTTTAVHLAYWLNAQNIPVQIINADVDQHRAVNKWLEYYPQIEVSKVEDPNVLYDMGDTLRAEKRDTIIDTPGMLRETTKSMIAIADIVIIPVTASALDLSSMIETVDFVGSAQKVRQDRKPVGFVFFNAVKTLRLTAIDTCKAYISGYIEASKSDIRYIGHPIIHRQIIADSSAYQKTVFDLSDEASTKASSDYDHLFTAILGA